MLKKIRWVLVIILIFSALCFGEAKKTVQKVVLKTQKDKLSYSLGIDIAKSLKNQGIDIDANLLLKGLTDGLSGEKPLLTDEEMKNVFSNLQKEMATRNAEQKAKLGVQNKKQSDAFLAENKTKKGVITLPSGLQYKELKSGNGPKPKGDDTVIVHYRGTLIDGTEFDSSYKRGEPAKFPVSGVIPGWTEALKLMKVGSKWQLFIPPNLAYGENGAGAIIGPNAALIFEVELISIEPK